MNKYTLSALSVCGGALSGLAWTDWCPGLILLCSFVPFFLIGNYLFENQKEIFPKRLLYVLSARICYFFNNDTRMDKSDKHDCSHLRDINCGIASGIHTVAGTQGQIKDGNRSGLHVAYCFLAHARISMSQNSGPLPLD